MADNTRLPLGTEDGDIYASDDIGGIKVQRVKVQFGADGSATDASSASPLPVTASQSTASNLNATANIKDGAGNALTSAARGSERALTVQVVDGSGTQITSFGGAGGTASNFGSAFPTPGTAIGYTDGTNMQGARVFDRDTGVGTEYVLGVNLRVGGSGGTAETGVAASPLQVSLANHAANATAVKVDGSAVTQPISGTITASQGTASSLNAQVVGSVAHDGVDSGNPVKVGIKAISIGSSPTAVAALDVTDWYGNRHGVPWVIGGHPNVVTVRANYTTAQTDAAIITVGAGNKIVVTRISVSMDNACTVDVAALIGFAAATTPSTTGVVFSHPGMAASQMYTEGAGSGILGAGADGEDLRITSEVPTGGSIDVVVSYYVLPS